MLDRRAFLRASLGVAGAAVLARAAAAQSNDDAIIRPIIEGVPPRFADLALDGPIAYPAAPSVFQGDRASYYVFKPVAFKENKGRLVVFSHGALAEPNSYRKLLFHWVSNNFMVIAPVHNDAIIEGGPTLRVTEGASVSQWPVASLLEDPRAWKERIDRCVESLDIASEIALTEGFELQTDRTVIAGHGYGAYMAQLLMGADVAGPDGTRLKFRDDRFFSGLCLSPQGPGIMGLDNDSWKNVTSPMLHLLAENDDDFTKQPWRVKAKAFELSAKNYKHLGMIRNSGATLFTKGEEVTLSKAATPGLIVKAMSAAFLKAYADYDTAAFGDMSDGFFQRATLDAVLEYRH